jgi:hypothetical protein
MRFVIQNVLEASVRVEGQITGSIGTGLLVFVGVGPEDDRAVADKMLRKLLNISYGFELILNNIRFRSIRTQGFLPDTKHFCVGAVD